MHHYLTDEQLSKYKLLLIEKQEALKNSLNAKKIETQNNQPTEPDPIDIASSFETIERLVSEINMDTRTIARIEYALNNFDDDFGYCLDCGDEIGEKRLSFDPSSTRCFDCQDIYEKKSRLFAR